MEGFGKGTLTKFVDSKPIVTKNPRMSPKFKKKTLSIMQVFVKNCPKGSIDLKDFTSHDVPKVNVSNHDRNMHQSLNESIIIDHNDEQNQGVEITTDSQSNDEETIKQTNNVPSVSASGPRIPAATPTLQRNGPRARGKLQLV
ncbi:hypothetical protein QAD02_017107 [Eretmocerus hayati]|uniref:Uncharacterized protein n=1 Tax=Eretmocerus hayati TaxID=131215 RepID=A0ACC2PD28_9HYME|nr:hypothetical protein QAD02_017107 [Eretmocerus hayati]